VFDCCVQRLGEVETGMESVLTDVKQLSDERDNIRSTFDDLTLKLIHSQASRLRSLYTHIYDVRSYTPFAQIPTQPPTLSGTGNE